MRARSLHRAGRVDKSPGRRRWLGASICTETVWLDRERREEVAVLNYHLTAEVQRGKSGYRPDRPLRVRRHKRERRRLERLVRKHLRKGRRVYCTGDSNFHRMPIEGLRNCWQGAPKAGTLGGRDVDAVHGERRMTAEAIHTPSDHDAVKASTR